MATIPTYTQQSGTPGLNISSSTGSGVVFNPSGPGTIPNINDYNGGKLTVSIINITSTGFTIRKRTQAQSVGTGKARFAASYEAFE
jgi:hypothetical protein